LKRIPTGTTLARCSLLGPSVLSLWNPRFVPCRQAFHRRRPTGERVEQHGRQQQRKNRRAYRHLQHHQICLDQQLLWRPREYRYQRGLAPALRHRAFVDAERKIQRLFQFDVGQNKSGSGLSELTARWYGLASAVHFQPTSKWSFTPRVEWFKDRDGFSTGTLRTSRR